MIQGGGVSINKTKLTDVNQKPEFVLLQTKYLLAQKGKKNYYLIIVEQLDNRLSVQIGSQHFAYVIKKWANALEYFINFDYKVFG